MTTREAVESFVKPGELLYLGNFGTQVYSVSHELIRQGVDGLSLLLSTGSVLLDQLIGNGLVDEVITSHCWNPIGPLPTHNFRRAMEREDPSLRVEDMSLGSLTCGIMAAAYGLPFVPTTPLEGTGQEQHRTVLADDKYRTVESPYDGRTVQTVPALQPETGFILAHQADRHGNAQWFGPQGELRLAALACQRTVVVAERLVDPEVIRRRPEATLPIRRTAAVVEEPWAAHPESVYGLYPRDIDHLHRYAHESEDPEGFRQFMDRYVFGVENRAEYVRMLEAAGEFAFERMDPDE